MWMKGVLVVALALGAACGSREEEVIRYLVAAEVAEKASLTPALVEVTAVEIRGGSEATAEAAYAPMGSRGPEQVRLRCRLIRRTARWQVDGCAAAE